MKNEEIFYANIKITKIRSVTKKENITKYKDKMYCVDIDDGHANTLFCEPTLKELFKKIKEELL